jgi:pSer/pThr/pTyr-binding forkhead associated (FHA) protein
MNGEKDTSTTTGTGREPVKKEEYPQLHVEKGEVYFRDKRTGDMKKTKEYVIGKNCDQQNPVTVGREPPKDILLPAKYNCASRKHCEIFFDRNENACFLVDYSTNGTIVNGNTVGGNRVRETLRLKHEDRIEIPAVGEKIELTFLEHGRGIMPYIFQPP